MNSSNITHQDPEFRLFRISVLSGLVGIVAGLAAYLLIELIALLSNVFFYGKLSSELPSFTENPWGIWLPLLPALGGLAIGLMARFAPQIQGHGIPEAMEAVLFRRSRISPKVALMKPFSTAIAIGTGGPFGAEGPIIQTGGALGSLLGQLLESTASERKVLLACGAAAGMAATFSTPIAAVILAVELLLFEFRSRSFIPLVIAATLATNVHFVLLGRGPLFEVGPLNFGLPDQLAYYAVLGLLAGGAAVVLTRALYGIEDLFEKLPGNPVWRPLLGGLLFGCMALMVPRILGVGYGTITDILNDHLGSRLLLAIMVFKALGMLVTLGSGTSGGLLAPTFMSSAAMGSLYAHLVNAWHPQAQLDPGAYALAALAAVFGAASRSTFAFVVFAFEITRSYDAILPIMIVAVMADGIGVVLLSNSIQTEKLARRGKNVHHEYEADPLLQMRVGEAMVKDFVTRPADEKLDRLLQEHTFHDQRVVPLLDDLGELTGMLTRGDALRALSEDAKPLTAQEAGQRDLVTVRVVDPVQRAVQCMLTHRLDYLPVVEPDRPRHLVGLIGREHILMAYEKRHQEESAREPGWLTRS